MGAEVAAFRNQFTDDNVRGSIRVARRALIDGHRAGRLRDQPSVDEAAEAWYFERFGDDRHHFAAYRGAFGYGWGSAVSDRPLDKLEPYHVVDILTNVAAKEFAATVLRKGFYDGGPTGSWNDDLRQLISDVMTAAKITCKKQRQCIKQRMLDLAMLNVQEQAEIEYDDIYKEESNNE